MYVCLVIFLRYDDKTTINVLRIEKILFFSKEKKGTFVFADYYIVKSSLLLVDS